MKDFYQRLLYIPRNAKVPEKVMLVRIGLSIGVILLCLAAMSVSAYAFFSSTVTSQGSVIKSAKYELEIISQDFVAEAGVCVLNNNEGATARQFNFTVKTTQATTATHGYAKISALVNGEEKLFYTEPIWGPSQSGASERSYSIVVSAGNAVLVKVQSQWGSCSQTPTPEGLLFEMSNPNPVTDDTEEEPESSEQSDDNQEPENPTSNEDEGVQPEQEETLSSEETEQSSPSTESSDDQTDSGDQTEQTDSGDQTEQTDQIDQPDQSVQDEQNDQLEQDDEVLETE